MTDADASANIEAAEPAPLEPATHMLPWCYIGEVQDGQGTAHGWQLDNICVMSSVDFIPVPRRWEYRLSVSLLERTKPPASNVIDAVCTMFGMPADRQQAPGTNPAIIHVSARVP